MTELSAAWQAEGYFIQWMMFSVLLVTLSMSFHHLARAQKLNFRPRAAMPLAVCVALVALGLATVALVSYHSRIQQLELGSPSELRTHLAIMVLGVAMMISEATFVVAMTLS